VIYIVSYRSILVVWCILGIYVVSVGSLIMILMSVVFYGGLMIVTILMVIPNGNAHYYYNSLIMGLAVVGRVRSIFLRVLTVAILMMVLIF